MKKIVLGILAHVDSGKTTLSEAMLYEAGNIKKLGRVDNKNATLDTHELEKKRGITIFSKQAVVTLEDTIITILDTPGHTDFSGEMERTLDVLDYAILVVNASDGVQSHTETLWNLLKIHNIPTYIYVNKMDLITADKDRVFAEITKKISVNIVDFESDDFFEQIAECDEEMLDIFLNTGEISFLNISNAILNRKIFPCFFGSALKLTGVSKLLECINKYSKMTEFSNDFSAKAFKISRDNQDTRLTHIKILDGSIKVKDILQEEKIQQIRIYQGENFKIVDEVNKGDICALVGLQKTYSGQGFGINDAKKPVLQPILTYSVEFSDKQDPFLAYEKIKILGDEDPLLSIIWNDTNKSISMGIMGEIQIEILESIIEERFGFKVSFGKGIIVYKETILNKTEGIGHFEPLRHYAEVRILLEPTKSGEGIIVSSKCKDEHLGKNFQSLVLSYLARNNNRGYLTGSNLTDIKITLVDGKSHNKHTEGGDFRQATHRALQQGLRKGKCKLLEPWYEFDLKVPAEALGKAINDLENLQANINPPEIGEEYAILTGSAPVVTMRDYAKNISSFTKGNGRINCRFFGYFSCHNEDEIIKEYNFDSLSVPELDPNSVFCSHGSGFTVKWQDVEEYAHTEKYFTEIKAPEVTQIRTNGAKFLGSIEQDKELMKIFEKTYGPIKRAKIQAFKPKTEVEIITQIKMKKTEYLLVDGYNIIFAWEELNRKAQENLEFARAELIEILCNYQGFSGTEVIVVFDAYKVKGNHGNVEKYHNITVVYTKEAETADMYIEKATFGLARNFKTRVATSDALEQLIIWGHGAFRVSAETFYQEVMLIDKEIRKFCE